MIIAQITDFHAMAPGREAYGLDTNAMLERAVAALLALEPQPDCVLLTGDLTDTGSPEAYRTVLEALAPLGMPLFPIPGNHDSRDVLAACLRERCPSLPRDGYVQYVVEDFPVRLIGLDTVVPGDGGGEICAERQAWLERQLERGQGRPTVIFMHHPPFLTGIHGMDGLMCRTSPQFKAVVAAHPEVERIICGHYHRPIQVRWGGTIGFVAPSIAHQVALDLQPGQSNRFVHEPPGFALHVWNGADGLVSHTCVIGEFGPRHDFKPI